MKNEPPLHDVFFSSKRLSFNSMNLKFYNSLLVI